MRTERTKKQTAIAMTTMGLILALFAIAFKGCQPPEPQFDTPTPTVTANVKVITPTPSAAPIPTDTPIATATPTAIILITRTATPTATATDSPTATPTATATERLWYYWTPEPTATAFTVFRQHCLNEFNGLYWHLICVEIIR